MNNKTPWEGTIEPFRIWGNLYFVGTAPASTHVVDTGDGLILFDCGYQESLYIMLDNMRKLGLSPEKIKAVFLTHGHIDHCGAAAAIRQRFGCKIYLGEKDFRYVDGSTELSFAPEMGMSLIPFVPDVSVCDGDEFLFGNTRIRCVATPGHTEGCMSYIFNVSDKGISLRAGLSGGIGLNTLGLKYLEKYNLPCNMREVFIVSMNKIAKEPIDIFLGNHADQNRTLEKAEMLKNGVPDAFVCPDEWGNSARESAENCKKLILSGK